MDGVIKFWYCSENEILAKNYYFLVHKIVKTFKNSCC